MKIVIVLLIFSTAISYIISSQLIRRGRKICMLDIPNERSSHYEPTLRGGGIGIVVSIIMSICLLFLANEIVPDKKHIAFILGLFAVSLTGYLSDKFNISIVTRLSIQIVISMLMVVFIGMIRFPVFQNMPFLGVIITLIWITGLANIYNFMDGIDGLAAVQGIVLGAAAIVFGIALNNHFIMFFGAAIAGAVLGFLRLNITPAKIFMGDTGSYAIGFIAAAITLFDNRLFVPVAIVMGTFLFDTTITLIRRVVNGERWYEAHKSHFYQRALKLGYSHMQISAFLGSAAVVYLLLSIVYLKGSFSIRLFMLLLWLATLAGLAVWVNIMETRDKMPAR